MQITIEPAVSGEPQLPVKTALPNILVQGFLLARRNWFLLVLAYAINLVFGLLAGIPLANGLAPFLDHSLAAQRISGTIDLITLAELALHLRETQLIPIAFQLATWLNMLQALVLFGLFTWTVFLYVSGEAPGSSVRRGGVACFWRFVRAALMVGAVAGILLGILLAARAALLAKLALVYTGGDLFVYAAISGAVVFLAALVLRLWFDLVEVYLVRNAMDGELRAHRALLPACELLGRFFFRIFGSFLLTGVAGVGTLVLCLLLWKALPADLVWLAALLAQVGLFLLLASRFWQRGLESALVLAADPPMLLVDRAIKETPVVLLEEPVVSLQGAAGISGLAEPTLSELVKKLQSGPWAMSTDATSRPILAAPPPVPPVEEIPDPTLDRHAAKMPLGGTTPKETVE